MATKLPRRRKLTELVSYHRLVHKDWDESHPIMHSKRMADKLRCYCRSTRPRLNDLFLVGPVQRLDFLQQFWVDERSFFCRSRQGTFLYIEESRGLLSSFDDEFIRLLLFLARFQAFRMPTPR